MDNHSYTSAGPDEERGSPQSELAPRPPRDNPDIHIEMKTTHENAENGGVHGNSTPAEGKDTSPASAISAHGSLSGNGKVHGLNGRPSSGVSGKQDSHEHPKPCRFSSWLVTYPRTVFCKYSTNNFEYFVTIA